MAHILSDLFTRNSQEHLGDSFGNSFVLNLRADWNLCSNTTDPEKQRHWKAAAQVGTGKQAAGFLYSETQPLAVELISLFGVLYPAALACRRQTPACQLDKVASRLPVSES